MQSILAAWLGEEDLKAMEDSSWPGPIAQSLRERSFSKLLLLSDLSKGRTKRYLRWLKEQYSTEIDLRLFDNTERANFTQLFDIALSTVNEMLEDEGHANFTFNISSGTPLTGAIWVIIAKFHVDAEIIRASVDLGVETVDAPDALKGSDLSERIQSRDEKIEKVLAETHTHAISLQDYTSEDAGMSHTLEIARRAAPHDVGVLIIGEPGTGRTRLATAIHYSSHRNEAPCVVIDPSGKGYKRLKEEIFGRTKIKKQRSQLTGQLAAARGGTVVLESLDKFPISLQLDLLHTIKHKQYSRVGDEELHDVDVRFIATAAPNINKLVANGTVLDSLFLRLSVAFIRIPSLRERPNDFEELVQLLWDETARALGNVTKTLSPEAITALRAYPYPGNIRELRSILARTILWSDGVEVTTEDVELALSMTGWDADSEENHPPEAIVYSDALRQSVVLSDKTHFENLEIPSGFSLKDHLDDVSRLYLSAAIAQANGNKRRVAELLGFGSYQSVRYWMRRLDLE